MKQTAIFDTELIGKEKPVFLTCVEIIETGEQHAFWHDKRGHTAKLEKMIASGQYTFVGFNSENFDRPLIAAAAMGHDEENLKIIATHVINENMRSWQTYREFDLEFLDYDHIDLIETAPGVMISLKQYAGRMGYPTMQDMPFHHDDEIDTPAKRKEVESYCFNDLGVTKALYLRLKDEMALRVRLSEEHGIDLRSKSDAQIAEAILKKAIGINGSRNKLTPLSVGYEPPDIISTKSEQVQHIIDRFSRSRFLIHCANGSPVEMDWQKEPFIVGKGLYKVGLGGLHSQHDVKLYLEETEDMLISDFDVGSYYPSIMLKCGIVPNFGGNRGEMFLEAYREIYIERLTAKAAGMKVIANSLKITLNGTFGKLGSIYSAFYSPDLLIAVTITGQLNLLCLIAELDKLKGVMVRSSNTDGLVVTYPPAMREKVLAVFAKNAKRTGFEYEETKYRKYAAKDVNNYIAIKHDGSIKAKGLYAPTSLMKNPTMEVCSDAAAAYLAQGTDPFEYIEACNDMTKFVETRNVKGGGVQHERVEVVDDWVLIDDKGSAQNAWFRQSWLDQNLSVDWYSGPGTGVPNNSRKPVYRKSRPKPVEIGVGGKPFGRVARWYMTTKNLPPITYVGSGNKVAGTEGGHICMTLPKHVPKDLNRRWYVEETHRILRDLGVPEFQNVVVESETL